MITQSSFRKPVFWVSVLLLTQLIFLSAFTEASSRAPQIGLDVSSASPPATHSVSDLTEVKSDDFEPGIILLKVRPGVSIHNEPGNAPKSSVDDLTEAFRKWGIYAAEPVFPRSGADLHVREALGKTQYDSYLELTKWYRLSCPTEVDVAALVTALKKITAVEWAEPNYVYQLAVAPPNDEYYSRQWGLPHIGADRAWDLTTGSPDIVIAVIDSGVDLRHPDLASKIWRNHAEVAGNGVDDDGNGYIDDIQGWNWANNNNYPQDDMGHGTHVAGIAAAVTNNYVGVAGVCPGCLVMPLKVCDPAGCRSEKLWEALVYAADQGASVINMSLGGTNYSAGLRDAINYAWTEGVTLVAAAGNQITTSPYYPAAYDHVTAVAATMNVNDLIAPWSNSGAFIDLAAPGKSIYSTWLFGDRYDYLDGTSMATPFVSGSAALVTAALPPSERTPDRVTDFLETTAKDLYLLGWDNQYGWGRVDTYKAVLQAVNPPRVDLRVRLYHSSRTNHSATVTVRVRHRSTGELAYETQATTTIGGEVVSLPILGIPAGNYDISVKTDRSVSMQIANVALTSGSTTYVDFSSGGISYLKAGDFNQDDKVNMFDLVRVLKAFQYQDLSFDFDGSGRVTILEVNMVLIGLRNGLVGDDFPNQQDQPSHHTEAVLPTGTGSVELLPLPWSPEYEVGDQFDLYAIVVTPNETMAGADLIIRYDPCALRVLGISNGDVFDGLQQQTDYPELGEVRVSGEGEYRGIGAVAILRFQVVAGNTQTSLSAWFRPNRTTESNMVAPESGAQILGDTYGVALDLSGAPNRPPITVAVNPATGSYVTRMETPVFVTVHDACGGVVTEKVEFEIQHDGMWEILGVDQNKYNGWSTLLRTETMEDQAIQLRVTVKDDGDLSRATSTASYILDRVAPAPTMTLPPTVPANAQFWVSWSAIDNLSGVSSYDIEYRNGIDGSWNSWFTQTSTTSALFHAQPGQDHYFRVRVRDVAGNESRFSDEYAVRSVSPKVFLPYVRVQ